LLVAETYVGAEFCRNSDIKKKSKRPNSRATRKKNAKKRTLGKKECKKKKPPAQKKEGSEKRINIVAIQFSRIDYIGAHLRRYHVRSNGMQLPVQKKGAGP